ncbi:hypothetical protein ACVW0J_001316 [Bradyrhizobium sp. i1.7.7]
MSRISSEAASIWIGWSRFLRKALHCVGHALHRALRDGRTGCDQRDGERGHTENGAPLVFVARKESHHENHFELADLF